MAYWVILITILKILYLQVYSFVFWKWQGGGFIIYLLFIVYLFILCFILDFPLRIQVTPGKAK